jgi:hypothetical protein
MSSTRYLTRTRQFGIKREATRNTAESAPTKWYPIMDDVDVDYSPKLLANPTVQGYKGEAEPIAGRKLGTLKFKMILDAQTIGEFLKSCCGTLSSAVIGVSTAYTHTIGVNTTDDENPSYTMFFDFKIGVKKYNGCVVKSLKFSGPVDNYITVDIEALFIDEASGSMGSPSYPTSKFLTFAHVTPKIAGSTVAYMKSWELTLDNGAIHDVTLNGSQSAADIRTPGNFMVSGSMEVFMESETERAKMLANTAVALRWLIEGLIANDVNKYTLDISITAAHYEKFPFDIIDNMLGAKVSWKGYYNGSSQLAVSLINLETAYS